MSDDGDGPLRAAVFDAVPSQMAVLDSDGTIVDTNEEWRSFGIENDVAIEPEMVGENYLSVCQQSTDALASAAAEGIREVLDGERDVFAFEYPCHSPDEQRWFLMRTTPFEYDGTRYALVFHLDITERRLAELDVEDRNETLEMLAGVISHDLRSPLSVALARSEMLGSDDGHAETIQRSLERMNDIIEDALVLAREGQTADEEPVRIDAIAEEAWSHVETDGASLSIESERTVLADRSLLTQLFENLFRNAIDHGSEPALPDTGDETVSDPEGERDSRTPITVTVGTFDEGFFVADDGPGIPPEQYERVFETGYTTDKRTGTGLGLTIVSRVAAVHDWSVDVTASESGGARFEVTGVEFT